MHNKLIDWFGSSTKLFAKIMIFSIFYQKLSFFTYLTLTNIIKNHGQISPKLLLTIILQDTILQIEFIC